MEQYPHLYIAMWIVSIISSIFNMVLWVVYLTLLLKVLIPTYKALKEAAELYARDK